MLEDTCNRFTCESKRHDVRSTVEKLTLVLGFINTKKKITALDLLFTGRVADIHLEASI